MFKIPETMKGIQLTGHGGSEAGCAGRYSRRIQADLDESLRRADQRTHAEARSANGQTCHDQIAGRFRWPAFFVSVCDRSPFRESAAGKLAVFRSCRVKAQRPCTSVGPGGHQSFHEDGAPSVQPSRCWISRRGSQPVSASR